MAKELVFEFIVDERPQHIQIIAKSAEDAKRKAIIKYPWHDIQGPVSQTTLACENCGG